MSAVAELRTALAADPAVPQRDALLDPAVVAERLAERLAREGRLAIERCERLRAKYQVGRSLRVLYRIEVAGESHTVAARTFAPRRCEEVHREALASAVPTGALRPVAHDRELATVFWTFPNDRKLATLPALFDVPEGLARSAPRRWTRAELTAYAPEKSATARCLGADGDTVAFAKVYAGDEGERTHAIHTALADAAPGSPRVARALAYSREYRTLFVEPIEGAPDRRARRRRARARARRAGGGARGPAPPRRAAGPASVPAPGSATAGRRRGADRPRASRRRRPRPRARRGACRLVRPACAARLRARRRAPQERDPERRSGRPDRPRPGRRRCGGRGSRRPARHADGGALRRRALGRRPHAAGAKRCSPGTRRLAPLPPADSLRWHEAAALLVERALRAVQRVREPELEGLGAILDAAEEGLP